jgi:hypothetical protein
MLFLLLKLLVMGVAQMRTSGPTTMMADAAQGVAKTKTFHVVMRAAEDVAARGFPGFPARGG